MRKLVPALAIVLLILALTTAQCQRTKKKKPVKHTTTSSSKGSPMLPGDNGKLEQLYTMGKDVGDKVYIAVHSVQYSPSRFILGERTDVLKKDEKLLIIKFSAQNPNKSEYGLRFDTLRFTAIDSQDVNHLYVEDLVRADDNTKSLDINLKPAQKIECATAVIVPAKVSIPKLMVEYRNGGKVLRYDLHGLIKGLPAPYADPADTSGATMLEKIPGQKDTYYPMQLFDIKYVSSQIVNENIGDSELPEGQSFLLATFTVKNASLTKNNFRFDTVDANIKTADGEKVDRFRQTMF